MSRGGGHALLVGPGGHGYKQPGGGTGAWQTALSAASYSFVADDSSSATAVANRTALDTLLDASSSQGLPVYFPDGTYTIDFSRSYYGDASTGRLLIDYPNAVFFGDGPTRSIINARSIKTTVGRRATFTDDTVAGGRRSGAITAVALGSRVTLAAGEGNNFRVGHELYVSPNSNGSSPRTQAGSLVVSAVAADTVTVSGDTAVLCPTFVANDYLFVKHRLALTVVGDATNFTAPEGTEAVCEVWASPNQDGSSPRVGAAHVVHINTSTGVLTLGREASNDLVGFTNGDYLFINVSYSLFEHRLGADSDEVAYNLTFRDLALEGEFYGATDEPNIYSTLCTGDVINYLITANNTLHGPEATEYTVLFDRCHISNGWAQVSISGSTTPATRIKMIDCTASGGRVNVFMSSPSTGTWKGKSFEARGCTFLGTDVDDGSHSLYINPAISVSLNQCRFFEIPAGKFGLQHWGSSSTLAKSVQVEHCYFAGEGTGILLSERSPSIVSSCTFETANGMLVRNLATISNCLFRLNVYGTCIADYFDASHNSHISVTGNTFDFSVALGGIGVQVNFPTKWTITGNTFTARSASSESGAPVETSGTVDCLVLGTASYGNGSSVNLGHVLYANNEHTFARPSGNTSAAHMVSIQEACSATISGNNWRGRTSTSEGVIKSSGGVAGSGRIRILGNTAEVEGGDFVNLRGTWSATPNFEICDNVATCAGGNGIQVITAGAFNPHYLIRGNRFTSNDGATSLINDAVRLAPTAGKPTFRIVDNVFTGTRWAVRASSQLDPMAITGHGNEYNFLDTSMALAGVRHGLRGRNCSQTASVASATGILLSPNFDSFDVTGTAVIGAIGRYGGDLACDGDELALFWTGTAELGSAGNILASAGARSVNTWTRLKFKAGIDTATTPLGQVGSFVTTTGVITMKNPGEAAAFRVGMPLKVDDAVDASSVRVVVATPYVTAVDTGANTITVQTHKTDANAVEVTVTGMIADDYLFLGPGRWVEVQ